MAELYLETQYFLNTKWQEMLKEVKEKEKSCFGKCGNDEVCQDRCKRTLIDLNRIAKEKQEIYVSKGVEYCKSECWNTKDIQDCSQRCLKDYSVLLNEFQSSLINHLRTSSFYNTE